MDIDKIKLVVDLTKAKLDILKLKADHYSWTCHVDGDTKQQLINLKDDIDIQLRELRNDKSN